MQQQRGGTWHAYTWLELHDAAATCGSGLLALGVSKGDRVGLLLRPSVEGLIALLGTQGIGGIPFGIYPNTPTEAVEFLVETAEPRVLVFDAASHDGVPHDISERGVTTVVLGGDGAGEGGDDVLTWDGVVALGAERRRVNPDEWERLVSSGSPDDVSGIYFTSGTTGPPKGALLSSRNLITGAFFDLFGDEPGLLPAPTPADRAFHEFPLAGVLGPIFGIYYPLVYGCTAFIPEDIEDTTAALQHASPTMYQTFPRMWELRASETLAAVQAKSRLGRGVYELAMAIRGRRATREQEGRSVSPPLRLLDAIAYRTVCRAMLRRWGFSDLGLVLTGGAPLSPELIQLWRRWGVVIRQIYGQTESGGMATIQTERFPPLGLAGRPGPRMDIRLDEDGEILIRGEGVFLGYLNLPEATAAAIDADGWLHTGDIGVIEGGNLRVVDRKSEIIVMGSGKAVVASEIENVLKQSRYIRNAIVVGDARPYLVALLELDAGNASEWARRGGRDAPAAYEELAADAQIAELVERELAAANGTLQQQEKPTVRSVRLLPKPIDPNDPTEVTPTRKLRRRQLAQKHNALIEEMYAAAEATAR